LYHVVKTTSQKQFLACVKYINHQLPILLKKSFEIFDKCHAGEKRGERREKSADYADLADL